MDEARARRFFEGLTAHPRKIFAAGLIVIAAAGLFVPSLRKDTTADAYMPPDHPSILYRELVEQTFGLSDPVVVAVVADGPEGVFDPETLELVAALTDRLGEIEGVDPDRVRSLATEKQIVGTSDAMLVEPFFDAPPASQAEADRVREAVMAQELYLGYLVAEDGSATTIVAELTDQEHAQDVYDRALRLTEEIPRPPGVELHVAGRGAATGYLGAYVDADNQRLNPLAAVLIAAILYLAYRTSLGVALPLLVVVAAVLVSLGVMAALRVPFYNVTSALSVILISIGVADGIHILGQYYEEVAKRPGVSAREATVRALVVMWRPVTVTSVTSIAGFLGLGLASYMPPMRMFGAFGALGVGVAWAYSLFVLPAVLVLPAARPSPALRPSRGATPVVDRAGRATAALGRVVVRHSSLVLAGSLVAIAVGVSGASRVKHEMELMANFRETEPIYVADRAINRRLYGTNNLDVVIDTGERDGLLQPENLRRIEEMQRELETLPRVQGSISIVDYVKQMHQAMNADRPESHRVPDDADLIAQYFLLFSAASDPRDLEHVVDFDYRLANLRITANRSRYSDLRGIIPPAQDYIDRSFNGDGVLAHLGGQLLVNYHWVKEILPSHVRGVAIAVVLVWMMTALCFRSALAGLFAVIPVSMSLLVIYAVMGFAEVWLSVVSSIFATIAIGVGVDFAVHTLDRTTELMRRGATLDEALSDVFSFTGRALLLSFLAVFAGFGVLVASRAPPLVDLGMLIAAAVLMSFLASMTLLPALLRAVRPAFLPAPVRPDRA